MGFENAGALDRMLASHERATSRAAQRIADAGVSRMERETVRRTPIDTNPFRHEPDRPRGTLRNGIHRLEGVTFHADGAGGRWEGEVVSYDPVARLVEFDTPPHVIRPRSPDGWLRFQSRDGWTSSDGTYHPPGTWVHVREVHHPGTTGQHMFQLGAIAAAEQLDEYARPELVRWTREIESGRF